MAGAILFEQRNGKIQTSALEYNIVEHCNLKCANCDHASPLLPTTFIPVDTLKRDLDALEQVLHTAELKIIGGEPLLHPRLLDILAVARSTGIADSITVASNGMLLHRVGSEFWQAIDRLWLSLYPGVRIVTSMETLETYAARFGFRLDVFRMNEFRHTLLYKEIDSGEAVRAVFHSCELPWLNYCHTLRNGRYFKCSPAPFAADRLHLVGIDYRDTLSDGVAIHNNPDLIGSLLAYLSSKEHLPACRFCLGSSGRWFAHTQGGDRRGTQGDDWRSLLDWRRVDLVQ